MRSITGARRETRVRAWGDARGDPPKQHLSRFGRRLTPCLPRPQCSNGEIYFLRRRGRKNQAGGLRIRLRMAMARAHLAPFVTTSTQKQGGPFGFFFLGLRSQKWTSKQIEKFKDLRPSGARSGGPGPSQALWLGANNPTPGLRKTLTDSGFAARLRALGPPPCGLGACALGAPASLGKERKLC